MGDRAARSVSRYLDLLRDTLLDHHYSAPRLRRQELIAGERPQADANSAAAADGLANAGLGRVRLEHLERCLQVIRDEAVDGDLVEAGTGGGGAAIFMCGFLEAHELSGRRVWVADRFEDGDADRTGAGFRVARDFNTVREGFARFGLLDDRVVFLQGPPALKLAETAIEAIALLRVDSRDPDEVDALLSALYDRVAPGGFVIVDGYGAADCEAAVDAFRSARGVVEPLERIDWSAAAWRTPTDPTANDRPARLGAARRTSAPVSATDTKDLGVVVVFHNMRREARRTLHSLSRAYQRGVDDVEYEVIVLENGSDTGQCLGEEFVRGFGSEFRYIDLGDEAASSPAVAMNRGIAASTARNLALMIDGAHVLTPGVFRYGMLGLSHYAPAVVITKHWYLGPGQQPVTVGGGYDKQLEDQLFGEIDWPTDGYRLFEIAHFIGNRDWFDGDWESNCIFVPRALVEQSGAMDESFSSPGGGFVNLDFYERMVCSPGINLVTMLGEGSFHQVHGGTTTNTVEPDRLVRSYEDEYEQVRGRRFYVPLQQAYYIGRLAPAARRFRPRRMNGLQRFRDAHMNATDNRPSRPAPIPQDLTTEFSETFWRSGECHRATWLGKPTHRPPTDLFAYQELICRLRPEWIVETRTGAGGRALFLASVCDLIDSGRVLSIDDYPLADPPQHERVTHLRGDPAAKETARRVNEIVGEPGRSVVIVGAAASHQVAEAIRNYAPLVPVGSYLVIEDTILDLNQVWPDFGPGPAVAGQQIRDAGDFVADPWFERFGVTFNVAGFLRRAR